MVSKLVVLLTLSVLTLSIGGRAEAQPGDYRTYFTFSAPVTLPGLTLPAGKYIFRLADSSSSRKIINVLSEDGRRSLAMLLTIPNQATKAPQDAEIRFMETDAQVPPPIKTWWYAGKAIGYEFIYPRDQALRLAKSTKEPILTTAKDTTDFRNADLSRIERGRRTGRGHRSRRIQRRPMPAVVRSRPTLRSRVRAAPARRRGIRKRMSGLRRGHARSCHGRRARCPACSCLARWH